MYEDAKKNQKQQTTLNNRDGRKDGEKKEQ
jgi:hypothetical protein